MEGPPPPGAATTAPRTLKMDMRKTKTKKTTRTTAWSRSGAPFTTRCMLPPDAGDPRSRTELYGYADLLDPGDVHVPHTVDEWADFTVQRVEQLRS